MDILKDLIANPGYHHVAEIVIGYLDKKFARDLVGNRELLPGDDEQDFLMKTLRKQMYNEAKKICEETRFRDEERTMIQGYPFFADVLDGLKNGDCLETFKQFEEILSLLEEVKDQDAGDFLYFSEAEGKKGSVDMIEILKKCLDDCQKYYSDDYDDYDPYYCPNCELKFEFDYFRCVKRCDLCGYFVPDSDY